MCSMTITNRLEKYVETTEMQDKWIKGSTKGSLYRVPQEIQQETIRQLIESTNNVKIRTEYWRREAAIKLIDIGEIENSLQWDLKDMPEVSEQSTQLTVVNLHRENTVRQVHCCKIIREVHKPIIDLLVTIASKKMDPSNSYQERALIGLKKAYLKECSLNIKQSGIAIEQEEARFSALRQRMLSDLSLLIKDPECFEAKAIRENTLINLRSTVREMCTQKGVPQDVRTEIINIKNKAVQALGVLHFDTPKPMIEACQVIIAEFNRVTSTIFCYLNSEIRNGQCFKETRITDYN